MTAQAYVVTNIQNGKQYVGITSKGFQQRWKAHVKESGWRRGGWALHRAIAKYGPDSFSIEWVASATSWADICAVEAQLIERFNSKAPRGYNLTCGGEGVVGLSPEARAEIAQKNTGRKHTADAIRRIGQASKGHVVTAETRLIISQKHNGKVLSAEHRQKLSARKSGIKMKPRSQGHCQRISDGLRRAWKRRREAESVGVL